MFYKPTATGSHPLHTTDTQTLRTMITYFSGNERTGGGKAVSFCAAFLRALPLLRTTGGFSRRPRLKRR